MLVNLVNNHSLDIPSSFYSGVVSDEVPNTSSPTIESSDKRGLKKSSKTLLLDATAFMDMNIICISSVCCDLRLYDVSSKGRCNLRFYIRSFPYPLSTLYYHCSTDEQKDVTTSKLIIGDMVGSVRVIYFQKNFKTKFREGSTIKQISYQELMKVSEMKRAEMRMNSMKCFIYSHSREAMRQWLVKNISTYTTTSFDKCLTLKV